MPPKRTKKTTAAPLSQSQPNITDTTPATPAAQQDSTRAHWTIADKTELIDFILDHKAEGGDGLNFKGATWTAAAKLLDAKRTKGGIKTSLACKNKFTNARRHIFYRFLSFFLCSQTYILQLKEVYLVVDALKQVSGFTWDDEYGAHIKTKGWPHYDTMKAMMPTHNKSVNVFQLMMPTQEPGVSSSGSGGGSSEDIGVCKDGEKEEEDETGETEKELVGPKDFDLVIDPRLHTSSVLAALLSAVMAHKRPWTSTPALEPRPQHPHPGQLQRGITCRQQR
jgi:hypothetical protein